MTGELVMFHYVWSMLKGHKFWRYPAAICRSKTENGVEPALWGKHVPGKLEFTNRDGSWLQPKAQDMLLQQCQWLPFVTTQDKIMRSAFNCFKLHVN